MIVKNYGLQFDGYWREPNIGGLPALSGIYGVYAAVHNLLANTVTLNRLLYIGEAGDVRARVRGHEKWPLWRSNLRQGEVLCFTAAPIIPAADRQRAEAAMIFEHKPPCNGEYLYSFPYDQTTVTTSGQNALMKPRFLVYRTTPSLLGNALSGLGRPL